MISSALVACNCRSLLTLVHSCVAPALPAEAVRQSSCLVLSCPTGCRSASDGARGILMLVMPAPPGFGDVSAPLLHAASSMDAVFYLVIQQHPMSGSASGPSPSPRALDWCKKILCVLQEKMTPEQRQHVLQAAERHREILQCQVVSSEVQKRMKDVQVQPPSPSA